MQTLASLKRAVTDGLAYLKTQPTWTTPRCSPRPTAT